MSILLDEVQTIKFIDVDEMRGALKGYMEKGKCTIGEKEVVSDAGICAEWGGYQSYGSD